MEGSTFLDCFIGMLSMWLSELKKGRRDRLKSHSNFYFAKKYEIIKNMAHAGHLKLMLAYQLQGK